MVKKIITKVINVISIIAITISVLILLSVVLTKSGSVPNILGYSVFRVMSGSMEPAITIDSLIVVKKTEASQIMPGDIISFYSQDPALDGAVNTHRVVSAEEDQGSWHFITKGDANQLEDKYLTSETDLIGKVIFVSHTLGVIVHLLSNPLIFIPLIVLPLFIILLLNLIKTVRYTKGLLREEEEAAVREAIEEIRKQQEAQKKPDEKSDNKSAEKSDKIPEAKPDEKPYKKTEVKSDKKPAVKPEEN